MGQRELVALINLSSLCLVMVKRLFLRVPHGCLRFVIVVFPDYTHLLFDLGPNGFQRLSADRLILVDIGKPSTLQTIQTQVRHCGTRV